MSCFFRHIGDLFDEAGVDVTPKNRKALKARIATAVGSAGDCSSMWKTVKQWRDDAGKRAELVEAIRSFDG